MKEAYTPSGLNQHFVCQNASFEDYIQHTRSIISQARIDITTDNRQKILMANGPSEYKPPSKSSKKYAQGFLMIHGLLDSPYSLSSLFSHLKQQQQFVRTLLLPGHGTRPGDLLHVDMEDHLKAVRFAIDATLKEAEKVIVFGFSLGSVLASIAALEEPRVAGVVLLAPCIWPGHPLTGISHWMPHIKRFSEKQHWHVHSHENDYAKYQSMPYHAVKQVDRLCRYLAEQTQNKHISCPIFLSISADDEVVDVKAALDFFQQSNHPDSRLIYYTNKPIHHIDTRIENRPSSYPEFNVLDFSHRAIPNAPNHPHYGIDSDYQDKQHLEFFTARFLQYFNNDKPIHFGTASLKNLANYHLRRLTFNPDFDRLAADIDAFIRTL
jgi:esterase/lipase